MSVIATHMPHLSLVPLTPADAPELHRLVAHNRDHLTSHGDYADLVALPPEALARELSSGESPNLRFGIVHEEALIGRIDLVAVDPPRYGLGYWLDRDSTGKGHATAAVRALLAHAAGMLGASDVFAGVTHGNEPSRAVLRRTGFVPVAEFPAYTRFHRALTAPEVA